eukprot:364433-Chlamydomonas_euryale.AAC.7
MLLSSMPHPCPPPPRLRMHTCGAPDSSPHTRPRYCGGMPLRMRFLSLRWRRSNASTPPPPAAPSSTPSGPSILAHLATRRAARHSARPSPPPPPPPPPPGPKRWLRVSSAAATPNGPASLDEASSRSAAVLALRNPKQSKRCCCAMRKNTLVSVNCPPGSS